MCKGESVNVCRHYKKEYITPRELSPEYIRGNCYKYTFIGYAWGTASELNCSAKFQQEYYGRDPRTNEYVNCWVN